MRSMGEHAAIRQGNRGEDFEGESARPKAGEPTLSGSAKYENIQLYDIQSRTN